MNYWNAKQNELIKQYILADKQAEKNRIITTLLPELELVINNALAPKGIIITEELQQAILVHLVSYVIPRITIDKVDKAQSLIFIASRNYAIAQWKLQQKYIGDEPINNDMELEYNEPANIEEIRNEIIDEIDKKILLQVERKERTLTLFLLLFKEYLITHHYDESGLMEYVVTVMKIKNKTFSYYCRRVGIKVLLFSRENKKNKKHNSKVNIINNEYKQAS